LINSAAAARPAVGQVCQLRQVWQLVLESRVEVMMWMGKARPVVLLLLLLLLLLRAQVRASLMMVLWQPVEA